MAAEDFLGLVPTPPFALDDLGVAPMPAPPVAPQIGLDPAAQKKRKLLLLATLIGSAIGGQKTRGFAPGMLQSLQQQDLLRREEEQIARQQYQQEQILYRQQLQDYQQDAQRRQQMIVSNLNALCEKVPSLTSKEEYDRYIEANAAGFRAMGMRLDGNWLRRAVPYVAPSAQKQAQDVMERWIKSNQTTLENNPETAWNSELPFDRDGDGVLERVKVSELALLSGMFSQGPDGMPVYAPKDAKVVDVKSGADGYLADLIAQDEAEGKLTTPERRNELRDLANKRAKEAAQAPRDPVLDALARQRLEDAQNKPAQALPPATQRRVDAKAKAFDAQPAVKKAQTMAEAVAFVKSLNVNTTNPADDQALIYAFAKAMDPESVVREGEYATVQKYAQSWADNFGFNAQRIFSNSPFLTPQARQNMKATIERRAAPVIAQYQNLRREYAKQINQITQQGDGESYLVDYGAAFPADEPTTETPATGGKSSITIGGQTFGVEIVP